MVNTRRVRFRFRIGGRRWAFPFPRRHPRFGRRNPLNPGLQQEVSAPCVIIPQSAPGLDRFATGPLLAMAGALEVRIAETGEEVLQAQRLRYRVFYEEMAAKPSAQMLE